MGGLYARSTDNGLYLAVTRYNTRLYRTQYSSPRYGDTGNIASVNAPVNFASFLLKDTTDYSKDFLFVLKSDTVGVNTNVILSKSSLSDLKTESTTQF